MRETSLRDDQGMRQFLFFVRTLVVLRLVGVEQVGVGLVKLQPSLLGRLCVIKLDSDAIMQNGYAKNTTNIRVCVRVSLLDCRE